LLFSVLSCLRFFEGVEKRKRIGRGEERGEWTWKPDESCGWIMHVLYAAIDWYYSTAAEEDQLLHTMDTGPVSLM
jgi:hypothetical protein